MDETTPGPFAHGDVCSKVVVVMMLGDAADARDHAAAKTEAIRK